MYIILPFRRFQCICIRFGSWDYCQQQSECIWDVDSFKIARIRDRFLLRKKKKKKKKRILTARAKEGRRPIIACRRMWNKKWPENGKGAKEGKKRLRRRCCLSVESTLSSRCKNLIAQFPCRILSFPLRYIVYLSLLLRYTIYPSSVWCPTLFVYLRYIGDTKKEILPSFFLSIDTYSFTTHLHKEFGFLLHLSITPCVSYI